MTTRQSGPRERPAIGNGCVIPAKSLPPNALVGGGDPVTVNDAGFPLPRRGGRGPVNAARPWVLAFPWERRRCDQRSFNHALIKDDFDNSLSYAGNTPVEG